VNSLALIRYADDFVIMHENIEVVKGARKVIEEWLKPIGLELKPEKTRIAHTLDEYEDKKPGFDFLGFNIRQYEVTTQMKRGYKTLIKPSKKSVTNHYAKIKAICDKHKTVPTEALISRLNPVIRGWSNYFSTTVSSKVFSYLDMLVWRRIWRWCKRRHPNKSGKWIKAKYFKPIGKKQWLLNANGVKLALHSDTAIIRHVKVKGKASTYDGDIVYWATRRGTHPETSAVVAKLLKKQKGKCAFCGLHFQPGDLMEKDHHTPKALGGKDEMSNYKLYHRHCHDTKTVKDLKAIELFKSGLASNEETKQKSKKAKTSKTGMPKRSTGEEPDAVKVASPVLKTSRTGNSLA
jgi:RNA-directed DNA polymerase